MFTCVRQAPVTAARLKATNTIRGSTRWIALHDVTRKYTATTALNPATHGPARRIPAPVPTPPHLVAGTAESPTEVHRRTPATPPHTPAGSRQCSRSPFCSFPHSAPYRLTPRSNVFSTTPSTVQTTERRTRPRHRPSTSRSHHTAPSFPATSKHIKDALAR